MPIVVLGTCFLASCANTPAPDAELEPGFVRLVGMNSSAPDEVPALDGWRVLGKAKFLAASEESELAGRGVTLTGHAENMKRNSFLVSDAQYGDFELLVDVRIEAS